MADANRYRQTLSGWTKNLVWPARPSTTVAKILPYILVAAVARASAAPVADTQLIYNANFGNGSLEGSVDSLEIGPLQIGDSQIADTFPIWMKHAGAIEIGVT